AVSLACAIVVVKLNKSAKSAAIVFILPSLFVLNELGLDKNHRQIYLSPLVGRVFTVSVEIPEIVFVQSVATITLQLKKESPIRWRIGLLLKFCLKRLFRTYCPRFRSIVMSKMPRNALRISPNLYDPSSVLVQPKASVPSATMMVKSCRSLGFFSTRSL